MSYNEYDIDFLCGEGTCSDHVQYVDFEFDGMSDDGRHLKLVRRGEVYDGSLVTAHYSIPMSLLSGWEQCIYKRDWNGIDAIHALPAWKWSHVPAKGWHEH